MLFGETALRSHSDVITTSLRSSPSHCDPTTLPLRICHVHTTLLKIIVRFYDLTTFILRPLYSFSLSHKRYKSSPVFDCLYVIMTSCPFSLMARSCLTHLCHPCYRSLTHRHLSLMDQKYGVIQV